MHIKTYTHWTKSCLTSSHGQQLKYLNFHLRVLTVFFSGEWCKRLLNRKWNTKQKNDWFWDPPGWLWVKKKIFSLHHLLAYSDMSVFVVFWRYAEMSRPACPAPPFFESFFTKKGFWMIWTMHLAAMWIFLKTYFRTSFHEFIFMNLSTKLCEWTSKPNKTWNISKERWSLLFQIPARVWSAWKPNGLVIRLHHQQPSAFSVKIRAAAMVTKEMMPGTRWTGSCWPGTPQ